MHTLFIEEYKKNHKTVLTTSHSIRPSQTIPATTTVNNISKQHPLRCTVLTTAKEILTKLKAKARPDQLSGMARYGMKTENRLGVQIPELRKLAKEKGKNHELALELWKTGIAEARIVAAMVDEPEKLTETQMDSWVKDIDSWDIGDQVCINLFEKTPLAWKKNP